MTAALLLPERLAWRAVGTASARANATPSRTREPRTLAWMALLADSRQPEPDGLAWMSLSTDRRDLRLSDRIA